jgi:hypothetical protein
MGTLSVWPSMRMFSRREARTAARRSMGRIGLTQQINDLEASLLVQVANLTKVYSQVNTTLQELPLLTAQLNQQLGTLG